MSCRSWSTCCAVTCPWSDRGPRWRKRPTLCRPRSPQADGQPRAHRFVAGQRPGDLSWRNQFGSTCDTWRTGHSSSTCRSSGKLFLPSFGDREHINVVCHRRCQYCVRNGPPVVQLGVTGSVCRIPVHALATVISVSVAALPLALLATIRMRYRPGRKSCPPLACSAYVMLTGPDA